MEVTEVRIVPFNGGSDKLVAYAAITIDDCFVVRDLRVIRGNRGMFVAMPSRKIAERCQSCGCKNAVGSRFCNECGRALQRNQPALTGERAKAHVDIAHPITQDCRDMVEACVLAACGEVQVESVVSIPA